MDRILNADVPNDSVGVWWIGQGGYVLKSPEGKTLAVDPYLTDSCAKHGTGSIRLFPPPIEPGELKVDVYACTHDHQDHLDDETVEPYQHKDTTLFLGPANVCRHLRELGIAAKNIVQVDAGDETEVCGMQVRGIFAVGTGPDCPDSEGFLITFSNGKTIYISGDTSFEGLLERIQSYEPDLMLVCTNGKLGNLTIEEAATLAEVVRPKVLVPMHYGMFASNTIDPEDFCAHVRERRLDVRCEILEIMQPYML